MLSGPTFKENPEAAQHIVDSAQEQLAPWPVVILVDDADLIKDQTSFLWTVFTRFDPANDIFARTDIVRNKIRYSGPIVIDARMKTWYPDELIPEEAIVRKVDNRWSKYFR